MPALDCSSTYPTTESHLSSLKQPTFSLLTNLLFQPDLSLATYLDSGCLVELIAETEFCFSYTSRRCSNILAGRTNGPLERSPTCNSPGRRGRWATTLLPASHIRISLLSGMITLWLPYSIPVFAKAENVTPMVQ